jgi:hypothetical protein
MIGQQGRSDKPVHRNHAVSDTAAMTSLVHERERMDRQVEAVQARVGQAAQK